jgi:hypothetical protein
MLFRCLQVSYDVLLQAEALRAGIWGVSWMDGAYRLSFSVKRLFRPVGAYGDGVLMREDISCPMMIRRHKFLVHPRGSPCGSNGGMDCFLLQICRNL